MKKSSISSLEENGGEVHLGKQLSFLPCPCRTAAAGWLVGKCESPSVMLTNNTIRTLESVLSGSKWQLDGDEVGRRVYHCVSKQEQTPTRRDPGGCCPCHARRVKLNVCGPHQTAVFPI